MSSERTPDDYREGLERFAVPRSTPDIIVYPLKNPEGDRIDDEFILEFAIACFPEDEAGEMLGMQEFSGVHQSNYYLQIMEMNYFDKEKGEKITDIDRWLTAVIKARDEGLPIFALSFGRFNSDGKSGIYLHVATGVSPEEAFHFLDEFAQTRILGI